MTVVSAQTYKVEQFRGLHIPGRPFVLFNVWDAGSAKQPSKIAPQGSAMVPSLPRRDEGIGHSSACGQPVRKS